MAKTLFFAEKDEETYLAKVGHFLGADVPEQWRDFALSHREQGFAPVYAAYMVKEMRQLLGDKTGELLKR